MNEKEDLVDQIQSVVGRLPMATRVLLNILVKPQIIEYTKKYILAMDKNLICEKFESPWDCAKEAEANFENMRYGWLGAGTGLEYQWWCDPCRRRATEL